MVQNAPPVDWARFPGKGNPMKNQRSFFAFMIFTAAIYLTISSCSFTTLSSESTPTVHAANEPEGTTAEDNPSSAETAVLPPAKTPVSNPDGSGLDVSPPERMVKLIFIHHSCGENWLSDESGGLGLALMENHYFVSDTNNGWGPEDSLLGGPIGDSTDIGQWWNWFLGPSRDTILQALYSESGQHSSYSRLADDPGGENEIVMFKSCFPNSGLGGNPDDPPTAGGNPLQGEGSGSEFHTVGNAKRIYKDLLDYFASRPDKLFIVITAPPLLEGNTTPEQAANARAFNRWLVEEWLSYYSNYNVAVFDFYNILTSNGGDPNTNDLGSAGGNHHRRNNDQIEYITDQGMDTAAYAENGDNHPTPAGNQKATGEYIPLLNYFYHRWQSQR
jgi:hypothetical protein